MENETSPMAAKQTLRQIPLTLANVVRSELHLAQVEMKLTGRKLRSHAVEIGAAIGVTVTGLFPFMAFLVIGLGEILRGNFWLSSLIVSLFMLTIGAGLARRVYLRFQLEELTLPETRHALERRRHGNE
jgi:uncharacterized membrane protein YqjE